jgi:hypothetical protein
MRPFVDFPLPSRQFDLNQWSYVMLTKKDNCLTSKDCKRKLVRNANKLGCTNYDFFPNLGMLTATCTGGLVRQRALRAMPGMDFTFVTVQSQLNKIPQIKIASPNEIINLVAPWLNMTAGQLSTPGQQSLISTGSLWHLDRDNQVKPGVDQRIGRCRSGGEGTQLWVIDTGCRPTHEQLAGRAR